MESDHGRTKKLWVGAPKRRWEFGSGNIDPDRSFSFLSYHKMDDILETPGADVSKLQERGQDEEPDDRNSSADEEEGGLDWSKLP